MQENNPNNEIIDLIIRSLRKELDVEEEKILQDWLEEKTVHREEYNQYVRNYFHFRWAEEEQAIHQEQAWNKIFSTLERKKGWVGIMVWLLLWYCWLPWLSHYC